MEKYHLLIHQNLLLLTKVFPNLDMENKLQKGMFKKPNTKGMQTVFYSLMCILNPEYCRKFVPWPISFTTDSYKFRVAVIDFIKKECNDFEVPKLLPSLLNKADGVKYVRFLFNFITYVTKVAITKKYGELLCERPNVSVNFEENLGLLDNITVTILVEDKRSMHAYKKFKHHFSKWIKASKNNLVETLKDFQVKRQLLFTELKESIPHVRASDEIIVENLVTEFEKEMLQFKHHHDKLKAEVNRILRKQEYLLFLINIKEKTAVDILGLRTINNLTANENISVAVQVPVNTLVTKIVTNKTSSITTDCSVCLKYFLTFGRLIISAHLQRFLKLNLTSKHLMICHTANDISLNSINRVNRFEDLRTQLEQTVSDCKNNQLILRPTGGHRINSHHAEISHFLALKENYRSQSSVPVQTRNILPGFFVDYEYENNFLERMKHKMLTSVSVPNAERTSKLY